MYDGNLEEIQRNPYSVSGQGRAVKPSHWQKIVSRLRVESNTFALYFNRVYQTFQEYQIHVV